MKFFLDTNICIYLLNRRPPEVFEQLRQYAPNDIGVSTIVVSELQYGIAKSQQRKRNQQRLNVFLSPFAIIPYDHAAAQAYGDIRASLERAGQPIGREDLMIAAHAVALDKTLVTNNTKEFERVPNLQLTNWLA